MLYATKIIFFNPLTYFYRIIYCLVFFVKPFSFASRCVSKSERLSASLICWISKLSAKLNGCILNETYLPASKLQIFKIDVNLMFSVTLNFIINLLKYNRLTTAANTNNNLYQLAFIKGTNLFKPFFSDYHTYVIDWIVKKYNL